MADVFDGIFYWAWVKLLPPGTVFATEAVDECGGREVGLLTEAKFSETLPIRQMGWLLYGDRLEIEFLGSWRGDAISHLGDYWAFSPHWWMKSMRHARDRAEMGADAGQGAVSNVVLLRPRAR
ncbi:hypothetical protein E2C06_32275 [Dankookia rubra]|uniref:Uncharacterized protein n=1 Tax=Dankookia rubra TaxID=1442381 RepID=A0A4V3A9A4_9PROT|nr:hypothetical protein [Dankookia rubra]TDH58495.1 hypothetical protein E2C06_32275 [Dankookia rubra]